jgi:hypothetical protein
VKLGAALAELYLCDIRRLERHVACYMCTERFVLQCTVTSCVLKASNLFVIFWNSLSITGGTRWRSWLRDCTTNRRVMGLIPDGVIGIFH